MGRSPQTSKLAGEDKVIMPPLDRKETMSLDQNNSTCPRPDFPFFIFNEPLSRLEQRSSTYNSSIRPQPHLCLSPLRHPVAQNKKGHNPKQHRRTSTESFLNTLRIAKNHLVVPWTKQITSQSIRQHKTTKHRSKWNKISATITSRNTTTIFTHQLCRSLYGVVELWKKIVAFGRRRDLLLIARKPKRVPATISVTRDHREDLCPKLRNPILKPR